MAAGQSSPRATHYLPHYAVVCQDKSTTKVHVVSSTKSANNPSLNNCLFEGPSSNQLIFDPIVRFWSYKAPLTADLEKHFWWCRLMKLTMTYCDPSGWMICWRIHLTWDFTDSLVSCSGFNYLFLLNATICFHLEKYLETNEGLVQHLLCCTYINNIIAGGCTDNEAFDLYSASKIFCEGGFNFSKFLTNSEHFNKKLTSKRV